MFGPATCTLGSRFEGRDHPEEALEGRGTELWVDFDPKALGLQQCAGSWQEKREIVHNEGWPYEPVANVHGGVEGLS